MNSLRAGGDCRIRRHAERPDLSNDGARLTSREREIAQLVARGYSNKAIAACLKVSTRTVEGHVASIFGRLSIRARWQLTFLRDSSYRRVTSTLKAKTCGEVPTLLFRLV